ncbi:hypothetical protein P1N98_14300, partial [Tsukamurella tyrosinosolvens]|uniref:hypothetical protein n=1 Tax=Tsukamurella tyrosinosolvens TaxID=57704 RepID=UPI00247FFFDF
MRARLALATVAVLVGGCSWPGGEPVVQRHCLTDDGPKLLSSPPRTAVIEVETSAQAAAMA